MSEISDDQGRYAAVEPKRNPVVPWAFFGLVGLTALLVIGYFSNLLVQHYTADTTVPDKPPTNQISVGAPPPFTMPPDPTSPARDQQQTNVAPAPAVQPTVADRIVKTVTGETDRPVLMLPDKDWDTIGKVGARGGSTVPDPPTEAEQAAVAFGAKPHATVMAGNRATAVYDLTRTIRPGTRLFCTTQEAIDTTTGAGDFVCDVDDWVHAWDGMTPLIPPHSWIMVHYEELKNGATRVMAASGVLTSPDGVVMTLGDPFGMPDGSPGVDGVIQDNTWKRLKEGIILDFVQSAFQTAEALASKQNQGNNSSSLNFNMNTNNTQQAAERSLARDANIADVLRLPQASHISMTIQKPAFFQDVIGFVMRAGQR